MALLFPPLGNAAATFRTFLRTVRKSKHMFWRKMMLKKTKGEDYFRVFFVLKKCQIKKVLKS